MRSSSDNFTDFVFENGLDDLPTVLFAFSQRLRKMKRLFRGNISRQWRLIRVDNSFNQRGAGMSQRLSQHILHIFVDRRW